MPSVQITARRVARERAPTKTRDQCFSGRDVTEPLNPDVVALSMGHVLPGSFAGLFLRVELALVRVEC